MRNRLNICSNASGISKWLVLLAQVGQQCLLYLQVAKSQTTLNSYSKIKPIQLYVSVANIMT